MSSVGVPVVFGSFARRVSVCVCVCVCISLRRSSSILTSRQVLIAEVNNDWRSMRPTTADKYRGPPTEANTPSSSQVVGSTQIHCERIWKVSHRRGRQVGATAGEPFSCNAGLVSPPFRNVDATATMKWRSEATLIESRSRGCIQHLHGGLVLPALAMTTL